MSWMYVCRWSNTEYCTCVLCMYVYYAIYVLYVLCSILPSLRVHRCNYAVSVQTYIIIQISISKPELWVYSTCLAVPLHTCMCVFSVFCMCVFSVFALSQSALYFCCSTPGQDITNLYPGNHSLFTVGV